VSVAVLDAHALMVYSKREPGYEVVRALFAAAARRDREVLMCCVNVGEALYMTWRKGGPEKYAEVLAVLPELPIQIVDADMALATEAARFKATRKMSYADCFAAALAKLRGGEVVTGDPEFAAVEDEVKVRWLSPPAREQGAP
jgi:predicted nucleic acid-binding protein